MEAAGVNELAIRAFEHNFRALESGAEMMIPESAIHPVTELPSLDSIRGRGETADLVKASVVIKLNGGLGTGMGLQKAKSLLDVRDGLTFLDLTVRQILALRKKLDAPLRFLLMNSFSTSADTMAFLAQHPELGTPEELEFLQSKAPKIDVETMDPVSWPADPEHEWCPPGHGDIYPSFMSSGRLQSLLDAGVKYAFVSNSDNLGATLDPDILRYFAESDLPFMMEVTRRTEADKKGGHLATDATTGGLLLRESAQCAAEDEATFQDITKHHFFNTNNLWIQLERLAEQLEKHGGFLPLAVIKNIKTVDPRDKASTKVYQLETAMGAAISCFEGAGALDVPRSRFAPVKTTADLLALRSDAYIITGDYRLELHPKRNGVPPTIKLPDEMKLVDQLEAALINGAPSLLKCDALELTKPIVFEKGATFQGAVKL
jgi:UTP--glucose-1-phosphate uridylyltransferase